MKPLRTIILCSCIFMVIQFLAPTAMAIKRTSNINEYTVENERTRKKQNYLLHRNKNSFRDKDNFGLMYKTEPFEPDANPEELSAFIVDYANMIRNDVILLDNSVETRTRKRGNIKVEEYNKGFINLGENVFPSNIETINCSTNQQQSCPPPYICKESIYEIKILRKRKSMAEKSLARPTDLEIGWVAESLPISVGCICTRDYVI
ncbi:prothoracicotropic hormone isoform X2 [Manduca sexta]|uniref:Prothoracicotropic hormone n=1 Tax=Manduca sexta TaxID=7130 RepID=A0A922CJU2_MANSE|nr:prothoracicotropic hormone isoform X2 [Manduca sexta]KAG6448564.1 hypothetical protein O3G_MSEX005600 [Manduca sexta]